jgi:hypothetical protein
MKKVVEFLKRYWIAVTSGLVVLFSVVATLLWPVPGLYARLRADLDQRPATFSQLNSLLSAQRTLPKLAPDITEAEPLTVFPTDGVIERGEQAVQRLRTEAEATLGAAVRLNRRQLLVPGSLPAENRIARQAFLDRYKQLFAPESSGVLHPILVEMIGAGTAPTPNEIQVISERRAAQIRAKLVPGGAGGQPGNLAQIEREIAEMQASVGAEVRGGRAERIRVYASPLSIVPHQVIQEQLPPAPLPTFNAQLMLWLQQTALEAIASVNQEFGSTNVLDAPIKHVVLIEVPADYAQPVSQGSPDGGGAVEGSADLTIQADQPITRAFTQNALGLQPNSLFEPFPIKLVLRVDADRLPQILSSLSRGRLLLISNVNVQAVGSAQSLQEGYVYGESPVVEATIEAQVLLLRPWLAEYMPAPVRQFFQMTANPQVAG